MVIQFVDILTIFLHWNSNPILKLKLSISNNVNTIQSKQTVTLSQKHELQISGEATNEALCTLWHYLPKGFVWQKYYLRVQSCAWLGRSKMIWVVNLNMLQGYVMSKWRYIYWGYQVTFLRICTLMACSMKWFEFFGWCHRKLCLWLLWTDFNQYLVDLDGTHWYIPVTCTDACILVNTAWIIPKNYWMLPKHWWVFRWFKFTLKSPNSMVSENLFLAIWDTSHWNFLSNLVSRQLETSPRMLFGQFWHMSIFGDSRAIWVLLPKSGVFQKINFFSMREQWGFKVFEGLRWAGT